MAVFKLRGQSYPITNVGTLGNKIQACAKNAFASPADDAIAAYCVSRACPSIPPEIASWNSQSDFVFTLDEYEFAIFTGVFSLASLEKQLENTNDSTQRGIINQSIKSLKDKLGNVESEMNQAIANELSKSLTVVDVKPQATISQDEIDKHERNLVRMGVLTEKELNEARLQAIAVQPSEESAITEEEQRWLNERRAARTGARIVEEIIQ
jgi:hypothetical protein